MATVLFPIPPANNELPGGGLGAIMEYGGIWRNNAISSTENGGILIA